MGGVLWAVEMIMIAWTTDRQWVVFNGRSWS